MNCQKYQIYVFSITFFCYLVKYSPGEGLLKPSVQHKGAVMYCLRSGLMEFWGPIFVYIFNTQGARSIWTIKSHRFLSKQRSEVLKNAA